TSPAVSARVCGAHSPGARLSPTSHPSVCRAALLSLGPQPGLRSSPRVPEDLAGSGTAEMAGLPLRRAGRVIVLDPAECVLLLRYDDGPPAGPHWATPAGALTPGESYGAAASRELTEETGWDDVALLREVHQAVRMLQHGDRTVRQHERHFLARTDQA